MAERYPIQDLSLQNNDMPVHKFIPMEKLDFIQSNQVRILYYHNPTRFYVYLRQKINTHAQFQVELQRAMQNYQSESSSIPEYQRYQPVVAQDNHAVWHRATILNFDPNSTEVGVYFVDFGQQETISVTNIRPLPEKFIRQPAFAIPCRLYDICQRNGNEQSIWKSNDPVHDEFCRRIPDITKCKVCKVQEQICYDIEIEISDVGDLGTFLFEKNLVSRITMQTSQSLTYSTNPSQQQSFGRIPPGFTGLPSSIQQPQRLTPQNDYYNNANNGVQQLPTRLLQKPIVQQSPSTLTSTDSLSDIHTLPAQDGHYIITHVYNAVEFYGYSQVREKELLALHKYLEDIYNNNANDQSISVHLLMEGTSCVIQQGDKYHRVIIKHRESESRVSVKLVDRGDEHIVDTSELLQLEKKCSKIPAFAQPFRLYNYDESHSTANITRKLKRLILNQRVQITQHLPMINGFYPVEVKLSGNQLVNEILLSNDSIPIIPPLIPSLETQTTKVQQDVNIQRTNDDLPAPPKLLTAGPSGRTQPGRFTATNPPVVNEQTSRFQRPQQQDEQTSRVINGNQQSTSEQTRPYSRGFTTDEQRGGNNRASGFPDRGSNNDEQRGGSNRGGGFPDRGFTNDEQRGGSNRGGGFPDRGFSNDEQSNASNRGGRVGFGDRNFNRNNDDNETENGGQRSTGFNSRGGSGGFADRGNRGGFGDRNNYENRNENNGQRSGGFNNRGSFGDRGGRGGGFQDRNGGNRNNYNDDDHNENSGTQRSQGFGSRGGFNGERGGRNGYQDREGGGNSERRGGFGDRGGQRGGRGGRGGGRGERTGGFGDRNDNGFRSNPDNNEQTKAFSGWPNSKSTSKPFESGDIFIENEIPKESFQFVISHIETPNDFFIQSYSKADELSALTETLQIEYKDAPELNLNSIKPNQACLAKSSDDCWYRARVLSTNSIKTNVRFIDFGDKTDVVPKLIRQIANKFCLRPPYAYRCILNNVEANDNINTNEIIEKCANKQFNGKIQKKISDDQYLLQSDNFENLMIEINAIKSKSPTNFKCLIVYIDVDKHQFYIQNDDITMQKITDEVALANEVLVDDIQVNSMVISTFEGEPYRAIIEEDLNENVKVYFVDFGNRNICPKISLKKCDEQLKMYPYQAKCCQLYNVSLNDFDQAFKQLDEYLESDKIEICIVNQNDDVLNVRVYVDGECFNEKFHNQSSFDMDDQSSSTITTTTVKEQERPMNATGKRNNEEILSPVGNSLTTSMNIKRKKSESETEVNLIKEYKGVLTYADKNKPIVYIQLSPESDSNIERINQLIDIIVQENKRNSSYELGDHVIAQFTDDDNHYRARIESYSTSSQNYTVYFLDYGNIDENVPFDHLYSYSNELEQIEPQAHGYLLENQTYQTWINHVRPLIEGKFNEIFDFYFTDETKSIIHIKFDNENQIYNPEMNQPKTFTGNISGTNKDCFYIHISPHTDTLICEMDELIQTHSKEHKTLESWEINDLCIVLDKEQNQYFRGKILSINDNKYDVQCIDYGNVISNITDDELYLLTNEDLLKKLPLARQCRLYCVKDENQIKAIDEVIKNIDSNERVTITVENDQNDQCMFVMLFRENNDIVNDRYQFDNDNKQETDIDKKNAMLPNLFDSAIAGDDDTSNGDIQSTTNDQQLTSPIGIPQAESTHQYGDTTNATVSNSSPSSMTMNQTIDFGENDPSTSNATIKDGIDNDNLPLN